MTLSNADEVLNNIYDQVIVEEGAHYELYISANITGQLRHMIQVELLGKSATTDIRMVNRCADSAKYYIHYRSK